MVPIIIVLVLGILLSLIVLIFFALDMPPIRIGSKCKTTSDCPTGLTCSGAKEGMRCLIPESGSCSTAPSSCAGGLSCREGVCEKNSIAPDEESHSNLPLRVMTQGSVPEVALGKF